MSMTPCKVCQRHLRSIDGACPFCGTLATAALAIGLAFFSACGGKTPAASDQVGTISGADARPADADATPLDQAPDYGRGDVQPMYGVP